jgi:exodeoxyribonuclease VII small subunit
MDLAYNPKLSVYRNKIMTKKNLEELVSSMEDGELTLEESLQAFEKGIKLTRECQSALKNAEQKVQLLLNENGDTEEIDLDDVEE